MKVTSDRGGLMRRSTNNDLNYYFIFVVLSAGYNVQICGPSKYEIFAGILKYPYPRNVV